MQIQIALFVITAMITASCGVNDSVKDHLDLKDRLSGKWNAKAFDGELHEEWTLDQDGWMLQEGHYIEGNDTSYSAKTKIEKIGADVILLSVIRNSNPKIFKAVSIEKNEIIFENTEYKNPYSVKYEFLAKDSYRRTIKGYEKDSLVVYEFNFKKIK